jgi:uncharacterized membrane protein YfbV (UPF0208 family)
MDMTNNSEMSGQDSTYFHGEALAHDPWAKNYGPWILIGFVTVFALVLISMNLAGQVPGKSFVLKSVSDVLQFIGEGIGCFFCGRMAFRLYVVYKQMRSELMEKMVGRQATKDLAADRAEVQAVHRSCLAWTLLAIAIALYASGQVVWTSYDVHMNSADVPFPGLYDIGFVASYPFFLAGTLLLTRRNVSAVRRIYPLLDALAMVGASLALSWFFLLGPTVAGLPQSPGAAFLSIYFPAGDLFLVAVGAFLMFGPLSSRTQQPIFLLLCLGLLCLAVADSLLGYYNFAGGFNTGTLQDLLWPVSVQLIGLAAIEYPGSIANEQRQKGDPANAAAISSALPMSGRTSQLTAIVQTILPLILVLITCMQLLINISPRGGTISIQSNLVILALVLLLIARQTLTVLENNHLVTNIHNELIFSRRELYRKRREAEEAIRRAQEKQELEENILALHSVHTRVAHGDFSARAPAISGPLQPIAISINFMLDRLNSIEQQSTHYKQLMREFKMVQEAVERLERGQSPWPSSHPPAQSTSELQTIFVSLLHAYSSQVGQWHNVGISLDSLNRLARHLRETISKMKRFSLFANTEQANAEVAVIERAISEVTMLEQQQQTVLNQVKQSITRPGSITSRSYKLRAIPKSGNLGGV